MTQDIPPDFHRLAPLDEVINGLMPVFVKLRGEAELVLGFHVGSQHCNPRGHCHGGAWASLADMLMGLNVAFVTGLGGPTVSMSLDFVGAARIGQWVEGSARILRHTPRLGFSDCIFTVDDQIALRASAVFRRRAAPFRSREALFASALP